MNTSIKRFAAILFVASALSGAANAELNLVNFEKHADIANIDTMLATMLNDIRKNVIYTETTIAQVKDIYKVMGKMLAKKNDTANKAKLTAFIEEVSTALSARVNVADFAQAQTFKSELIQDLAQNNPGRFAQLRQKVGFAFDAAKTAAKTAPKTILGKLRGAQTKRTEDTNARRGKVDAFNTAFTAAVEKSLKDKKAVVKKELPTELERLSAELCEVSNEEQEQAHDAELTATFEALDYAIKAAKKYEEINAEVARFEADKYGYIRNRGSKEKSAKNIAGLTAKIVKAQTDAKAKLEKVTLTAKNTVVTVLDALVKDAQAATVKCPVTQKTATK